MKSNFMIQWAVLVTILLTPFTVLSQRTGALSGVIRDAVNNQPVSGAVINIEQVNQSGISDSLGKYSFTGIATGAYTITVSAVGYETQSKYNIPVSSGNTNELSFDLARNFSSLGNVVVTAVRRSARATSIETPLSVQRLTTEEIKSNPGGNFDISRVVQSLPGVSGSAGIGNGFRNDIIIRGGAPYENVYYLDGIEVPVINHFSTQGSAGGPQGILNVSFIEDVKLSTSAFDARYDNALSGLFEFRQKNGNTDNVQGNIRLSASELAATFDGPVDKSGKLTFLASARRSYLQFLFKALDLPIRPDYYDFQYKLAFNPNEKNSFNFIGIGAIDQFKFGSIRNPTLDKYYILDNVPSNNQWNYTVGGTWKRSMKNGFTTLVLSRNVLNIEIEKFDGNDVNDINKKRLQTLSRETENKLRLESVMNAGEWKFSGGVSAQYVEYSNESFVRRRAEVRDDQGNVVQEADIYDYNTSADFFKYGAFIQVGNRFLQDRLSASFGIRGDGNSFMESAKNPLENLSPRISLSYALSKQWNLNATAGSYTRIPAYTILGFQENSQYINRNARYIRNYHYVSGVEFLPKPTLRFTAEGFYKRYANVPVSLRDGISLANQGADFAALGNEPVVSSGKGEAYGFELFAQQKLTRKFFGFASYTYVVSRFSGLDGRLIPSAWDNRHLFSFTLGYKPGRDWEIGLKYRLQGGLPYTPFDEATSRINYTSIGTGVLDYGRFNQLRLRDFQQSDLRIDKKWNLRKFTIDVFLDVQNWTAFKSPSSPQYTFDRNLATGEFLTTNGQAVAPDGSNAIPVILLETDSAPLPTVGFILEF